MPPKWLSVQDVAGRTGKTDRAIRYAAQRALQGMATDGWLPTVKEARSRGGNGGKCYLIAETSLPANAQVGTEHSLPPATTSGGDGQAREAEALWRYEVIRPALCAGPKGSSDRRGAIKTIASEVRQWPSGRRGRVSEDTVERWLNKYENQGGIAGLQPKGRADRGRRRVLISREWDKNIPLDFEDKERIANRLEEAIKNLWADNECLGEGSIQDDASLLLAEMTRNAGVHGIPEGRLRRLCQVPRRFVAKHREWKSLAIWRNDRRAWYNQGQPYVQRERPLRPLEVVYGDVTPSDIPWQRSDGSVCHPRLVAWLDGATWRLFVRVVAPAKGRDVRNEDVAESFVRMVTDPHWGMPERIYIDNGMEYNCSGFIRDAMALVGKTRGPCELKTVQAAQQADRSVITALPYNAKAKQIEGGFSRLQRRFLSRIPGYVGGDRQKKKTKNQGQALPPFQGSFEEYESAIQEAVAAFNAAPIRSIGKSPNALLDEAIQGGWQRIAADPEELRQVFARRETRTVNNGLISVDGRQYYDDALARLPVGAKVDVRVPIFTDELVAVLDQEGHYICSAAPDKHYSHDDPAGAKESARRKAAQERVMREKDEARPRPPGRGQNRAWVEAGALLHQPVTAGIVQVDKATAQAAADARLTDQDRQKRAKEAVQEENERTRDLGNRLLTGLAKQSRGAA